MELLTEIGLWFIAGISILMIMIFTAIFIKLVFMPGSPKCPNCMNMTGVEINDKKEVLRCRACGYNWVDKFINSFIPEKGKLYVVIDSISCLEESSEITDEMLDEINKKPILFLENIQHSGKSNLFLKKMLDDYANEKLDIAYIDTESSLSDKKYINEILGKKRENNASKL